MKPYFVTGNQNKVELSLCDGGLQKRLVLRRNQK